VYNTHKYYIAEGEQYMPGQKAALTLKEASKRLGVHPNTLRNWEQQGVIQLIRLPGSRYRRVPVSEVQRLAAQMHSQQTGTGSVRLEPPSDDPAMIAKGQALARAIQSELAALDQTQTLEETMQALRGRSWS
jgi:excisionase family DNA binding protein